MVYDKISITIYCANGFSGGQLMAVERISLDEIKKFKGMRAYEELKRRNDMEIAKINLDDLTTNLQVVHEPDENGELQEYVVILNDGDDDSDDVK